MWLSTRTFGIFRSHFFHQAGDSDRIRQVRLNEHEDHAMPATKTKPRAGKTSNSLGAKSVANCEVLTLAEAAGYLRIAENELLRLVTAQGMPGRKIGQEWRFLKTALQDWLRTPPPSGKEALLAMAGAFKNDPFLDEIVRDAYQKRGRPMTENGK